MPDSLNVGTVPADSYVAVIPGLSNDGSSGHTFFQFTGSILDTSDAGPSGNDVEFQVTATQSGEELGSGIFTPAATQGLSAGPSCA
jgi:hypothetical protein